MTVPGQDGGCRPQARLSRSRSARLPPPSAIDCAASAPGRRREFCHHADALSPSLLIRLLEVEGGAAESQSRQRRDWHLADALSPSLSMRLLEVERGVQQNGRTLVDG